MLEKLKTVPVFKNRPTFWVLVALLVLSLCGSYHAEYLADKASLESNPVVEQKLADAIEMEEMKAKPALWDESTRGLSVLIADIRSNRILAAKVTSNKILITTKGADPNSAGERYNVADIKFLNQVAKAFNDEYLLLDKDKMFLVEYQDTSVKPNIFQLIHASFTLIFTTIIIGFAIYFIRQILVKDINLSIKPKMNFSDVIGAHEAKSALNDVTRYLKDPDSFIRLGVRPPRGVLMSGSPGVGKTQLAKALAGECGVNFIAITGGQFSSQYYGLGIQKVKMLFNKARKHAPCIVFVDEIDGVGTRFASQNASDTESNRIINQILAEMDGFDDRAGVIVIGATNHPSSLDPALLREGRFDRKVNVSLPNIDDRELLFRYFSKSMSLSHDIDFSMLARLSIGLTPASISFAANQAGLISIKLGANEVGMEHFLESLDIARMGEAKVLSRPMPEDERKRIAVHEAGHAVLSSYLKSGRVERVTIIPRGEALGVTLVTNDHDSSLYTQTELTNRILVLLGGRNAEKLILNDISSGASGDLDEASNIAYKMVANYGMVEKQLFSANTAKGLRANSHDDQYLSMANDLLVLLDMECFRLLGKIRPSLDGVISELLTHETISGTVVADILLSNEARPVIQLDAA